MYPKVISTGELPQFDDFPYSERPEMSKEYKKLYSTVAIDKEVIDGSKDVASFIKKKIEALNSNIRLGTSPISCLFTESK